MSPFLQYTVPVTVFLAVAGVGLSSRANAAAGSDATPSPVETAPVYDLAVSLMPEAAFSTGRYGLEERTRSITTSVSVECIYRRWTITAYLPYEYIRTPGGVTIINRRPVATLAGSNRPDLLAKTGTTAAQNRAMTARQRQAQIDQVGAPSESFSGMGDSELSLDYAAWESARGEWAVSVNGTVKLPTGNEDEGLGTGETDYRMGMTVSRSYSKLTPFVSLGYCVMGKSADSDLRNYAFGSAGGSCAVSENTDLRVMLSTFQASSDSAGADSELSFEAESRLGEAWRFRLYGLAGLSTSAPDYGGGISLNHTF